MYYVSAEANFLNGLMDILEGAFYEKATIARKSGKLYIDVYPDAGFKDKEDFLTPEQIKSGVIGGGLVVGLDGKKFCITVQEVKNEES